MEQRIPRSGERYRHFKGNLYQIVTVAIHSETGEKLVIYQALYGEFRVFARPYEMFMSEVDHAKYPEVTQKYRFERVEETPVPVMPVAEAFGGEEEPQSESEAYAADADAEDAVNPKLMAFYDAEDLETKLNLLVSMKDELDDTIIDNMAVVLDVEIPDGRLADRYEALKQCIRTRQHYEIIR